MSAEDGRLNEQYLQRLGNLAAAVEAGDGEAIDRLVAELTTLRESALYNELGTLAREVHETINAFARDDRLAELVAAEIPDAKQRLQFIVDRTDDAAHRTMSEAEASLSLVDACGREAQTLRDRWERFRRRELSKQEFIALADDIDRFFSALGETSSTVHGRLTDIMLAQDYQDITGQMIRQVVDLVREVEERLVRLVAISGDRPGEPRGARAGEQAEGPQLPDADAARVARSQDDVDDLLESLGF